MSVAYDGRLLRAEEVQVLDLFEAIRMGAGQKPGIDIEVWSLDRPSGRFSTGGRGGLALPGRTGPPGVKCGVAARGPGKGPGRLSEWTRWRVGKGESRILTYQE